MKRNPKRTLTAWVLTLAMVVSLLPTAALAASGEAEGEAASGQGYQLAEDSEAAASGTCGDNLTWTLSDTGTLTISGTGEMTSYPWSSCGSQVNIIVIESGVTSICDYAFYALDAYRVTIPATVTSIGEWAFANTSLTTVTIPNGVTEIGAWTFYNCKYLISVAFPDSVTSIGAYALRQCSRLTQIVLPASLTSLGKWTFARDSTLETVVFTGSRPDFGSEVFYADTVTAYYPSTDSSWNRISSSLGGTVTWKSYSSLSEISMEAMDTSSDFVVEDGELILYQGAGGSVTIPDTVEKIGTSAFRNCLAVTSVVIPSSVKSIGIRAFSGCANLKTVSMSDGLTLVGIEAFSGCTALTSVTLPSSVTGLGERAFSDCTALTDFQAGDHLTYIGNLAFYNCTSLKTLDLSNWEISLGDNVFLNCSELDTALVQSLKSAAKQAGPLYDYEIFLVNKYDTLYTQNNSVGAILYVKTDNPTSGNIALDFSGGEWTKYSAPISLISGNSSYPDVQEEEDLLYLDSAIIKVDGGYIFELAPEEAGTYTISVRESSAGQTVDTGTSITLTFVDYEQAYTDWLDCLIAEYTTSSMTPEEKFDAIVANAFNDWRYPEVVQVNGEWDVVSLLGEKGTFWERKRFDSAVSPEVLIAIGERVGYTVTWAGADNYAYHAYVYKQDGTMVTVCPATSTGQIEEITYIDFSVYSHIYTAEVTTPATQASEGEKTYTCTVCGATKTETIAKLAPAFLFSDVTNGESWYYNAVYWAYDLEITKGYDDGVTQTFKPNNNCTRAEFATFLYTLARAYGLKNAGDTGSGSFSDVKSGSWYYTYVMWAAENGIVSGYTDGTFRPNSQITRAEAVTMLYSFYKFFVNGGEDPAVTGESGSAFSDLSSTAWYYTYMAWAVENGVVSGYPDGTCRPNTNCTRSVMVVLLYATAEHLL